MGNRLQYYIDQIRKATDRPGIYAYRGQRDASWKLLSGATRRLKKEYGDAVLERSEFLDIYVRYHREQLLDSARKMQPMSNEAESDLQILAKLQHLGAATGLLDFSWSPLVGLWIACRHPECDGRVFVFDTARTTDSASVSTDMENQRIEKLFSSTSSDPPLWYWEPPPQGEAQARIAAQRSVFVIGRPLIDENSVSSMQSVLISAGDKVNLLEDLETMSVDDTALRRDIFGLAKRESVGEPLSRRVDAKHFLLRGNRFHQEKKFDRAIAEYSQCIDMEGSLSEPYFLRGNSKAALTNHLEAVRDYDLAIENKERPYWNRCGVEKGLLARVYFNRGNSLAAMGQDKKAIESYNCAIESDPEGTMVRFSGVYLNRGNSHVAVESLDEAIRDFEVADDHGSVSGAFNRANALVMQGRLSEAEECYERINREGKSVAGLRVNLDRTKELLTVVGNQRLSVEIRRAAKRGIEGIILRAQRERAASSACEVLDNRPFTGNVGNTGNFGGGALDGGEGGEGAQGFWVAVADGNE